MAFHIVITTSYIGHEVGVIGVLTNRRETSSLVV